MGIFKSVSILRKMSLIINATFCLEGWRDLFTRRGLLIMVILRESPQDRRKRLKMIVHLIC